MLDAMGKTVTKDEERAEELNGFCASVFMVRPAHGLLGL